MSIARIKTMNEVRYAVALPVRLALFAVGACTLLACGIDGSGAGTEGDALVDAVDATPVEDAVDDVEDTGEDVPISDISSPDVGPPCPPPERTYGAPCETDDDCNSGICLTTTDGTICTDACVDTCAPLCGGQGMVCRGIDDEDGVLFACQPTSDTLCRGCVEDAQCAGGQCLTFDDGTTACGRDCQIDEDCPTGYSCGDGVAERDGQCVPITRSCSCSPDSDGLQRPCELESEFGACGGVETCDGEVGWSACDAPQAAEEICNGLDDDCDGVVDDGAELGEVCTIDNEFGSCEGVEVCRGEEGFACIGPEAAEEVCDGVDNNCDGRADEGFTDDDGRFTTIEHCGGCGLNCEGRFAFASEVACDASGDEPRCVVAACEPGYQQVSDVACQPVQPSLCLPCTSDDECSLSSPGARCIEVIDVGDSSRRALVCGRDCSVDGVFGEECPAGYSCTAVDGGPDQCLPTAGTCSCLDAPDGFSVPCAFTAVSELEPNGPTGEITCPGTRMCDGDAFGACMLPSDVCDGFDNDCDGRIDDTFRDDRGLYTSDEHCGRCNNDCSDRFTPARDNATGVCEVTDGVPACRMVCLDGFFDLQNGVDDGCECEARDDDDEPDADPTACDGSCDLNCDGIDGNIARALFVSKTGEDAPDAGSINTPLLSIGAALERAAECEAGADVFCPDGDLRDIYVATGVYSENVMLRGGVSLYGGYSVDFRQRDPVANLTTIFGVAPTGDEVGTITALGIDARTLVSGFQVYGFGAVGAGESSYAVYLADVSDRVRITDNVIVAANGASGSPGVRGASGESGGNGTDGGLGRSAPNASCDLSPTAGGVGGASVCGSGGGAGGQSQCPLAQRIGGGECVPGEDDQCHNSCSTPGACNTPPISQGVGATGGNNPGGCVGEDCGSGGDPAYDFWSNVGGCTNTCTFANDGECDDGGPGSDFNVCALGTDCLDCGPRVVCTQCGNQVGLRHVGGDGQLGRAGQNGTGGAGCAASGFVNAEGLWVPAGGADGAADAQNGGGGGGGSAGAGYDIVGGTAGCTDALGGSGGGGGAGGCAGRPGGGGSGGGASFGVFIYFSGALVVPSAPIVARNVIERGVGGLGGSGGGGGAGGLGGFGGRGGFTYPNQAFCTSPGGNGGSGGGGGAGAGGGGGCGGDAVGIFVFRNGADFDVEADLNALNMFMGGAGGAGGSGGVATASGSRGDAGSTGAVADVVVE